MRWLSLLSVVLLVLCGVYMYLISSGTSLDEVYTILRDSREDTYVVARRSMDRLQVKQQGIPFEKWSSVDKICYEAYKRVLKEYGE
jgi:hypothetical protein